jgi:preprotein translocase SecE subunit
MAKSMSDKMVGTKATSGKTPAKQNGGGLRLPFMRSSSAASKSAAPKQQTQGPRGAVAAKPAGRMRTFFREVRVEMSKVTWPPRKELITSTGVVIVAVIIAGVYIGLWDFIWNLIVRSVGLG